MSIENETNIAFNSYVNVIDLADKFICIHFQQTQDRHTSVRPLQCGHLSNIFKHANVNRKKMPNVAHITVVKRVLFC